MSAAVGIAGLVVMALPVAAGPAADTSRIVVAGGAVTEVLYLLGLADRIVAVDTTSQHPPEALQTKKSIGYLRALSTEGVLSMSPTVIIASDKAGPPEVIRSLKGSGVPYIEIDDTAEPDALIFRVRTIAAIVGEEERGARLAESIRADFARLELRRRELAKPLRVLFVLSLQNGRILVGGRGTAADTMLSLAGASNVASAIDGFKPMTDEMLISLDPQAIVTMNRSDGVKLIEDLKRLPSIAATSAGRTGSFIEMDGLFLLGFGPRAPSAAMELMTRLNAEPAETRAQAVR